MQEFTYKSDKEGMVLDIYPFFNNILNSVYYLKHSKWIIAILYCSEKSQLFSCNYISY